MGGKFKCFDNSANCSTAAKAKKRKYFIDICLKERNSFQIAMHQLHPYLETECQIMDWNEEHEATN